MEPKEPVVVLLSGGMNSTVAAARVLDSQEPHLLYVDHGHAAAESETRAVRELSIALATPLHIAEIPSGAALSAVVGNAGVRGNGGRAPSEAAESTRHVPGFMLTIIGLAVQLARRINASTVICGSSQVADEMDSGTEPNHGDPQLRHVFYHAAVTAIEMSTPRKRAIELDTPFIDMSRADIMQAGMRLGAPFHLTWPCHLSRPQRCRECPGCVSYRTALDALGMEDPATHPVHSAT